MRSHDSLLGAEGLGEGILDPLQQFVGELTDVLLAQTGTSGTHTCLGERLEGGGREGGERRGGEGRGMMQLR